MVIKIMKDRKTLSHNDLMGQLLTKANFPLDTALVKQRIESLIEKDYLKRNAQDATIYEYLAWINYIFEKKGFWGFGVLGFCKSVP